MFGYFYNSSMRRYTVLLMDLLSGVQVERTRGDQKFYNKVPITNASKERFIIKLNNAFSNNYDGEMARGETILPRINIHMVDMMYNSQYKTGMQGRQASDQNNKSYNIFNPVPWKFTFEVSIHTRYETDMHTIVEQILPYFQPNFPCKIVELHDGKTPVDRDIQITIQSVSMSEELEGDRGERRRLEWTLFFELDGWMYANFADLKGEIKTTYLDFFGNMKRLPIEAYESVDSQVVPFDSTPNTWNGDYIETCSAGVPIPVDPEPSKPREN
ncbi:tail sheath stabilizer and completion protein [Aeromonas phage CC2]|uniref:Tail sheath stabilizer and completion protein n=1 Tax=Aeromonas phage CC2 TaxID=1204516 RepID=I6WC40_9CAUD|nr:tail sheath stabilizer and completion protein [Aeromonas phage CC2]AFN39545.1 tail sheath stabilizer and completion protein [Aeromonas phage CC2]